MPEGITKRNQRIADKVGDKVFAQSLELDKKVGAGATPWYGYRTTPAQRLDIARAIVADPQALREMHDRYRHEDGLPPHTGDDVNIRWRKDVQAMTKMVLATDGVLPPVVEPPPPQLVDQTPPMPPETGASSLGDGAVQTADAGGVTQ